MKKLFLIFIVVALLRFEVTAQTPPTLQIAETNGGVTVSWSNAPQLSLLQTTTNLSPPILWGNVAYPGFTTNFTASTASPQQFFRIAPRLLVYQFAIFYNINMEIDPGQPMQVNGPVFSNAGIWADSPDLAFLSPVSAAGNIYTNNNVDPFSDNYTGTTGSPTFLSSVTSQAGPLSLQNGNGTLPSTNLIYTMLDLPPPGLGAPYHAYLAASNQNYLFNQVDLIISNSATGINGSSVYGSNITIYYENQYNYGYLSLVTNDMVVTNITAGSPPITNYFKYYSFVTNVTFYDYRESDTVQALQIDVAKLNKWLTNTLPGGGYVWNVKNTFADTSKGHPIDSIYVYNNVPLTTSQLPAVRLVNGAQLPFFDFEGGLTIATPQPLYVFGNYNVQTNGGSPVLGSTNTASTYPAALMADAITILSTNWSDIYNPATPLSFRTPGDTTVNAATLTGIVPTVPTISGNYSGGVENVLRLLEDWNNNITGPGGQSTLTYNGSIVVMFASQYATNYWGNSNYYGVPIRNWSFDQNFANPNLLPPLTPILVNFVTP
jgi:hypothetical protein